MKDKISEFIDGELDAVARERLIDRLLSDPELQKSWADAHTVSALMRQNPTGEDVVLASAGFAERVSESVLAEPTVIAPNALNENHKIVSFSEQDKKTAHSASIHSISPPKAMRPAPIYALAASLALVAVLLLEPQLDPGRNQIQSVGVDSVPLGVMDANEIEALMVEHGEFSGLTAMNGLLAYAKVVNGESAISVQ